jgi:hypothetical protein
VYIAWLLPAAAGSIFDFPLWLIYAMIAPGLIWYLVTEGARYYEEIRISQPNAPLASRVPALSALGYCFVVTVWGQVSGQTRYCGLLIVCGFILMDLWSYGRIRDGRGG